MGARGKVAQTDNANNQPTSEAHAEQSKRIKHQLCQAYEIA